MERKFACYTPSPYFDFKECRMHDNSCSPHCNQPSPCADFYPACNPQKPHQKPIEKPNHNCCNCIASPCTVWFLSGIIFSNFIRR